VGDFESFLWEGLVELYRGDFALLDVLFDSLLHLFV
jgi:hypothetical protein